MLSLRQKLVFTAVTLLLFSVLSYAGILIHRSFWLYNYLKSHQRGWKGNIFKYDAHMGFVSVPNSTGQSVFPVGPFIPARFDENGFRIPEGASRKTSRARPLLLFLGCSFTFGDSCLAEETFSFLVGKKLQENVINAGLPGYGLPQMLLRARDLIPTYKPDVVVVQLSPWITNRGLLPFAPTYFGRLPQPFFVKKKDGTLALHPPLFRTILFDPPMDKYRETKSGPLDFLAFCREVSLPYFIHDHFYTHVYRWFRFWTYDHFTLPSKEEMITAVYSEIAQICRKNKARMVVLRLGTDEKSRGDVETLKKISGFQIIDAERVLMARAGNNEAEYSRLFNHWRGTPPVLVDSHPNPDAHKIIASEIVRALKR
ncbi:MAG: SGNH/GDSL hydrolase family protein [Elusimicrobia bacterium]|nr:SGNH/GDSL hydrolase family protein [Candidatus Obscuribacterium magneticum]